MVLAFIVELGSGNGSSNVAVIIKVWSIMCWEMHRFTGGPHKYRSANVCEYVCVTGCAVAVCFSLCQDWHLGPTSNEISLLARHPAAMASADTERDILQLDTSVHIMQERNTHCKNIQTVTYLCGNVSQIK